MCWTLQEYKDYVYLQQAILAVKASPKWRRAQFDCELARPNRGADQRLGPHNVS